jgi:hypothetical protein
MESLFDQEVNENCRRPFTVKTRTVLTKEDVLTIFQNKTKTPSATQLARDYRVSEKTIRDIWTGRTWAKDTWHLDKSRVLEIKPMGRPIGSRDTKPRKLRQSSLSDPDRTSKPDDVNATNMVFENSGSGEWSSIDESDSKESGPSKTEFCACANKTSGQTRPASLDEQLSDWGLFLRDKEWSDPFASDWLHRDHE